MTMMTLVAAEEEGSPCSPGHTACTVVDGLLGAGQAIAGNAATAALEAVAQGLANGAVAFLEMISTWWMNAPGPDLNNPAVASIQSDTGFFIACFAIIGFFIGLIRMLFAMDVKKIMTAFAPIVALIVVTGVYAVAIGALLNAGDSTAAWLLDRATDGDANLEVLASPVGDMGQNIGVFLIVSLLTFFGAIMNFLLMIFRDVIILVLLAFLPVVAASTGSASGKQAFQKINGWLIALLLFKPVAAGIYALGLRMLTQDSEVEGLGGELQNYAAAMTGMLILALAGLALPALIKFVAPVASMGAAAFGGGAAVAGAATVAAGAAVVAGTGGAAAPAVAGGGAASAGAAGGGAAGGGVAGAAGGGAASAGASGAAGGGSSGAVGGGAGQAAGGANEAASAGTASGGAGPDGAGSDGAGVTGSTLAGAAGGSEGDSGASAGAPDDSGGSGAAAGGADATTAGASGAESSTAGAGGGGDSGTGSAGAAGGAAEGGSSAGAATAAGASPGGAGASGGASSGSSGGGSGATSETGGAGGVDAGTPGGADPAGPTGSEQGGASGGGAAASGAQPTTNNDSGPASNGGTGKSAGQKTQQLKNVIDTGTASGAQINQAVEGDDGETNT